MEVELMQISFLVEEVGLSKLENTYLRPYIVLPMLGLCIHIV